MKRVFQLVAVATTLLLLGASSVSAQTVLTLPQKNGDAPTGDAVPAKVTPAAMQQQALMKDYKSPWPLASADEQAAYSRYVSEKDKKPTQVAPLKGAAKADASTVWTYTGFNQAAGTDASGNATGGLVDFNLSPFACDTVSSDGGLTPYAYVCKNKLYCFYPNYNSSTATYPTMTRTTYDANTLEKLDSRTVDVPNGDKSRVPYLMAYDDQRDIVYAISMEGVSTSEYSGDNYYLNILDTATCRLQRVGYLGSYWTYRNSGNYTPKAFTVGYGSLYVQLADDSVSIGKINPSTCETTVIGRTGMPTNYVYGLQPMIYDSSTGGLLVNHYDFENGTVYYKVSPYVPYGSDVDTLKTELIEKAPTGFTYFYKRPEVGAVSYSHVLDDIADLTATAAEGSTDVTLTFTVPTTYDGGKEIEFPSYASQTSRLYVYVDGSYKDYKTDVAYGSQVEMNLTGLTGGMHVIAVQIYPSWYEMSGGGYHSTTVVCGYDAPASVGNPTLSIADEKATITWDAPTEGRYVDFGSTFDASDLSYTVVRNTDGTTVADGITETSFVDADLADEIQTYSYTIYASSHGNKSIGVTTNTVSAGKYLALPYLNEFSDNDCLSGYNLVSVDGTAYYHCWYWNSYSSQISSGWGVADDWLITPAFKLESDKLYAFSYKLAGRGILYTTVGQGNTVEDQNTELDHLESDEYTDYGTKEYYYRPAADGSYYFGLHNYSLDDNDTWNVDNLAVKAIASGDAPDRVRSLAFTADANGALGGTLSFNAPATDIAGNALTSLSKVTVYDMEGNELGSTTSVTPGAATSIKVNAVQGYNSFKIVAANDKGEGWPVIIRRYVGPDTPNPVSDLKTKWGEDANSVIVSWTNPTEGVHGGYVDPSKFTYNIYKYDSKSYPTDTKLAETKGESEVELTIMDASTAQDQYVVSITVSNEQGESDYKRSGIVLGTPYDLPFDEPFSADGIDHQPYLIAAGINSQAWTVDQGYYNQKIQPQNNDGLQLVCINAGSEDGSSQFITPIIDFTSTVKPTFKVWLHHSDAMPDEAYALVQASTDGSKDFIAVGDTIALTGNNGWQQHIIDLSALNGKKAQLALYAYMPNPAVRIFSDNWSIDETSGRDLAVTAISQPYMPVVGDTATITVTVANLGAEDASNYSVLFNVDEETIDEAEPIGVLAAGKTATFSFTLPITAAKKNLSYNAQVLYDGDENEDNNLSATVSLDPTQLDLNAPTNLTLTGNDNLSWLAPEAVDGREVVLDFEDVPAFTADNIKGWKTYDGDGNLTTGFAQYYGNYWPYYGQPLAWMTWSAKEAGTSASIWTPYEGEKCLIHWGNYGADADGHTNDNPNDDWFISPEVKGGTELSFVALSNDLSSVIEIRTSSTDDAPESFTNTVKSVDFSETGKWQTVSVTLPEDAKYVALYNNVDGFGIMVDNISYTEAKSPVLKGYKVYGNGEAQGFVTATSVTAALGNGTYAVSAIYDLGESDLSNAVAITNGIADINADQAVRVAASKGTITVTGAEGRKVEVFAAGGQLMNGGTAQAQEVYSVPAGVYVVTVDSKPYKLIVK